MLRDLIVSAGLVASLVCSSGCAPREDSGDAVDVGAEDLTGTTGVERAIHFQSYVYVPLGSSDDVVASAIARQVKTAIGGLRKPKVSLQDRAAQKNLDPSRWTRTVLAVVDPSHPESPAAEIERVTFRYDDRVVASRTLSSRSAIDFVMLAGDYAPNADVLKRDCSDDATTETDSLWYHFEPTGSACKARVSAELSAIAKEQKALAAGDGTIGPREAGRWFAPVTAKLDPPKEPATAYSPEYDRLFGVADDRTQLVIYAFFGVDRDELDPDDALAKEAARSLRTILRQNPTFRPVHTEPFTWLLDFKVDGNTVSGVDYDRMLGWIVDDAGYPAEANDADKRQGLRRQALEKLAERWIFWDMPLEVQRPDGTKKTVTVELRSFYGYEDGSPEIRERARWRYLEAFWHGDVFAYNGHSHFGHGPLEPTLYGAGNFPDRYQIMLVGSCISFNYYHEDFFAKKPGGTRNLDMIVNGLPSYVWGGGEALARFVSGLVSGSQPTYAELLGSMRLDTPWGERGYDPMRVADGETDNVYSRSASPLTLTRLAPVYP
jgi:hypothetical protein